MTKLDLIWKYIAGPVVRLIVWSIGLMFESIYNFADSMFFDPERIEISDVMIGYYLSPSIRKCSVSFDLRNSTWHNFTLTGIAGKLKISDSYFSEINGILFADSKMGNNAVKVLYEFSLSEIEAEKLRRHVHGSFRSDIECSLIAQRKGRVTAVKKEISCKNSVLEIRASDPLEIENIYKD